VATEAVAWQALEPLVLEQMELPTRAVEAVVVPKAAVLVAMVEWNCHFEISGTYTATATTGSPTRTVSGGFTYYHWTGNGSLTA
jgi:hypothetical protein